MSVKTTGFDNLLISMEHLHGKTAEITMKCCHRLALRAVSIAKKGTPVMDGDLRKSWAASKPVMNGNIASCEMTNNMYYASWVEDGHRQVKRWVPGYWMGNRFIYNEDSKSGMMLKPKWITGFHMGRRAMNNIEANAQKYLKNDLELLMKQAAAKAGGKK
jgi:hypothetical protein